MSDSILAPAHFAIQPVVTEVPAHRRGGSTAALAAAGTLAAAALALRAGLIAVSGLVLMQLLTLLTLLHGLLMTLFALLRGALPLALSLALPLSLTEALPLSLPLVLTLCARPRLGSVHLLLARGGARLLLGAHGLAGAGLVNALLGTRLRLRLRAGFGTDLGLGARRPFLGADRPGRQRQQGSGCRRRGRESLLHVRLLL